MISLAVAFVGLAGSFHRGGALRFVRLRAGKFHIWIRRRKKKDTTHNNLRQKFEIFGIRTPESSDIVGLAHARLVRPGALLGRDHLVRVHLIEDPARIPAGQGHGTRHH